MIVVPSEENCARVILVVKSIYFTISITCGIVQFVVDLLIERYVVTGDKSVLVEAICKIGHC